MHRKSSAEYGVRARGALRPVAKVLITLDLHAIIPYLPENKQLITCWRGWLRTGSRATVHAPNEGRTHARTGWLSDCRASDAPGAGARPLQLDRFLYLVEQRTRDRHDRGSVAPGLSPGGDHSPFIRCWQPRKEVAAVLTRSRRPNARPRGRPASHALPILRAVLSASDKRTLLPRWASLT
jgi:hypothetical protein